MDRRLCEADAGETEETEPTTKGNDMTILDRLKATIDKRNTWIDKREGIRRPVEVNEVAETQIIIMEALVEILELLERDAAATSILL